MMKGATLSCKETPKKRFERLSPMLVISILPNLNYLGAAAEEKN